MKQVKFQKIAARKPHQDRARYKVELILEAAMRLLDKGGMPALTTNAVAQTAGVSIGTLYQYFANKEAILDALAERRMANMSAGIVAALSDPSAMAPEDRIAQVVRAVMASYGGRRQVHRLVMQYTLSRGVSRLAPLIEQLVALLAEDGGRTGEGQIVPISRTDAFVLANAFAGVMRAAILAGDDAPPIEEIERALARLVIGFAERDG
jgi:AcrR family transcriptional regulator